MKPNRTIAVAMSLVTFALAAPVATADTLSLSEPDANAVVVFEGGELRVLGYDIDENPQAMPIPYSALPGEACAFVHQEVRKILDGFTRTPSIRTSASDLLTSGETAPYDSDREADLVANEECREMRDDAQNLLYENTTAPVVPETCGSLRGIETCAAVHHWQCDIGLLTYYNMISLCIGGVFPDN